MTDDHRVTCVTCRKLVRGWCTDARRAGLAQSQRLELARDLIELPQHCPAHVARARAFAPEFPAPNDAEVPA